MGTAILSSFSQTLYFIFLFLFFFSFFKLIDNMEAKSDFDTLVFKAELEAELENIASGLRRLIGEDIVPHLQDEVECFNVDSPLLGESFSATSSSSSESMKRLFEEEPVKTPSSSLFADNLFWRPLFDSVEDIDSKDEEALLKEIKWLFKDDASAASSTDDLDWRPLFDSVEDVNSKDETTSFSRTNIQHLMKDGKNSKASLGDLGTRQPFKEEKDAAASLSDLGMNRLFQDGKVAQESLSNLGMQRLFKEGKTIEASLSDLGTHALFEGGESRKDFSLPTRSRVAEAAAIATKYAALRARKKLVARRRVRSGSFIGPLNEGERRRENKKRSLAEDKSTEEENVAEKKKKADEEKEEKESEGKEKTEDEEGDEEKIAGEKNEEVKWSI